VSGCIYITIHLAGKSEWLSACEGLQQFLFVHIYT